MQIFHMDQNKPRKFSNKATLLAVFSGTVGLAVARFVFDSLDFGILVGVPLGVMLGIVIYWLLPNKQSLTADRYRIWAMFTLLACTLVLGLAELLRGDLGMAVLFVGIGSLTFVLDFVTQQQLKNSHENDGGC